MRRLPAACVIAAAWLGANAVDTGAAAVATRARSQAALARLRVEFARCQLHKPRGPFSVSGCGRVKRGALAGLLRTPSGGYRRHIKVTGTPARFRVGAAVTDFSTPAAGKGPGDASNCDHSGTYNGPRPFAYTEPYVDTSHAGHYAQGDPTLDCNANSRWDGNLIGGGSNTPRFFTKIADPVTARALVVSNGKQTIAVEVVDQEGLFNVYQQQIRARVAADGFHLSGIFISATHDESAPDSLGLGGVSATISGVDNYWIQYMVAQSAKAIESAYRAMRPATIRYSEALEPNNLRQCWSSYPFVDDQHIPILQAVGSGGRPIVTLASVSQHVETLGFNGGTPLLDTQNSWVSSDWVNFFRASLERRFGGVAIEMAGAVGSVESPEVYPGPISRRPHLQLDASHPAGCRTEFSTPVGQDLTGKGHVALGYYGETKAFGDDIARSVISALRSGMAYPSRSNVLWGARANVCLPFANILFAAAAGLGVFANRPGYTNNCAQQLPIAPNGSTTGTNAQTQVASFQIGDAQFIAAPGEVFPFTYLGSFLGPQDMPIPGDPMTPMLMPHLHTQFRFFDGLAEDMVGYIFPPGNAVGVPTVDNPGALNSDTDRFGCNHSDDSEAASPDTGTLLGTAFVTLLDDHGGAPERVTIGRYVLPDGSLSRDPLGGPESLQCTANRTFVPDGPAVGVELPGGKIVHPLAWLSLSGLPQVRPDRDTRGYYDSRGRRVWLNVFPDVTLP